MQRTIGLARYRPAPELCEDLRGIEGDAEGRKPLNRVEEAAQFSRAELSIS